MSSSIRAFLESDAMFYRPRLLHRIYAWVRGHFWIPCPICKRRFGEHEWKQGNELWLTERDSVAVCPNCGEEATRRNEENGYPLTERPLEPRVEKIL